MRQERLNKLIPPNKDGTKSRYEGVVTGLSKRNRPAHYYKLSEKDHPTIIEGLKKFASLYHIALKIGCGYTTLKLYMAKHPELKAVQEDAKNAISDFVESQFLRKITSGNLGAMCFYAERRMGWTNRQTIDTNAPIPTIVLGTIDESQIPAGLGEPVQLGERTVLQEKPDPTEECRETEEPEDAENEFLNDDEDVDDDWGDDGGDENGGGLF